jgi:hypothetical protein
MDAITEITDKSNNWADTASHSLELQYTKCFILKPDPKISKSLKKLEITYTNSYLKQN